MQNNFLLTMRVLLLPVIVMQLLIFDFAATVHDGSLASSSSHVAVVAEIVAAGGGFATGKVHTS
jgi:hypothetical protein